MRRWELSGLRHSAQARSEAAGTSGGRRRKAPPGGSIGIGSFCEKGEHDRCGRPCECDCHKAELAERERNREGTK